MPVMPRDPKNPATKIAYQILGKPDNIKYKKSAFQKRVDQRLVSEETMRAK